MADLPLAMCTDFHSYFIDHAKGKESFSLSLVPPFSPWRCVSRGGFTHYPIGAAVRDTKGGGGQDHKAFTIYTITGYTNTRGGPK